MLTYFEYNELWAAPRPNGFAQPNTAPPSYHEYVQREIYFNDYLDLFRGIISYPRVNIPDPITGDDRFYVEFGLLPADLPFLAPYCIMHNNTNYLIVDYAYPWTDAELNIPRCLRYVMIGEAAPLKMPSTQPYGSDDNQNSFFYNFKHTKNSNWLNAPLEAFGLVANDKKLELIELANCGYLLIDLFPFAINYSSAFRSFLVEEFNRISVASNAYYNLLNKITEYLEFILVCNEAINEMLHQHKNIIIAFSGPPIVHHYLAGKLGLIRNEVPMQTVIYRIYLINWPDMDLLNGIYFNDDQAMNKAPVYKSCCYSKNFQAGPHAQFIKNAFGLPE